MRKFLFYVSILLLTACMRVEVIADENPNVTINPEVKGKVTQDTVLKFRVESPDEFKFEIKNINGDIRVFRNSKDEITVILKPSKFAYKELKVYRYEDDDEAGVYVKSKEKYIIMKHLDDYKRIIEKYRIDMDVFLPDDMREVKLTTINGTIHFLDRISEKNTEITTVNGKISGSLGGRNIEISVVNGKIHLDFSGDKISISNVNGSVRLDLGRFSYADISNVNGSIRINLSGNLDVRGDISTLTGSVNIDDIKESPLLRDFEKSRALIGKTYRFLLGTGRSSLDISNVNGSITIELGGGTI